MNPRAWLLACLLACAAPTGANPATAPATDDEACAAADDGTTCTPDDDDAGDWSADAAAHFARVDELPRPANAQPVRALARAIADDPAFGGSRQAPGWTWRWRYTPEEKDTTPEQAPWLKQVLDTLRGLSPYLGSAGQVLLWGTLLALLLIVWRRRHALLARLPGRAPAGAVVAGIDLAPLLAPGALPADVLAAARHLWAHDHAREALGLLYRAALHHLGARFAFAIPDSGTEQECLRLVGRRAPAETTAAFRVLVDAWVRCAWAHAAPPALEPLLDAYARAVQPAAPAAAGATTGEEVAR